MRRLFALVVSVLALVVASCSYDDTAVWNKVNSLEDRVAKLEELCKKANSDIEALQTIVEALQQNDYVTSVAPVIEGGKTVGYTITFAKSGKVTIYNGKDGVNGDGSYVPNIGVKKDVDGIYYWTLDGEWLLDESGNKVLAQGETGKDGVTPKLKIENDYWYVSYDNGATWSVVGKATAEGASAGDSIFESVEVENDCVIFYLTDGSSFTLPISNQTDGDIIRFLDNSVKLICVSNWDTDGDGELSKAEAAAVKSLGIAFAGCDMIISFDELKYFTGLTEIEPYAFCEAYYLHKITLPNTIKVIGEAAFGYCIRLKELNINEGVTKIGYGAFESCIGLKSITIPGSVEEIEVMRYDEDDYDYYGNPFEDCCALETINSPYASDGRSLIMNDTLIAVAVADIDEYRIPDGVKSVANDALCGTLYLYSYDWDIVRFPKVIIPESVEYIDYRGLYAMEYHFESMTPPSLHEEALGYWDDYEDEYVKPIIYVPDGALKAYLDGDWDESLKECIYFELTQLETPDVTVRQSSETSIIVSWDAVSGADTYIVNFNGENYTTTECSYTFENLNAGDYSVRVKAQGVGHEDSEFSSKVIITLTGPTSVDWFSQELFLAERDGYTKYNSVWFTWKGNGVVDLQYCLFTAEDVAGAKDADIKANLYSLSSDMIDEINTAEGATYCFSNLKGSTTYVLYVLVANSDGLEFFTKGEITTEEAVVSDNTLDWLGTYTAQTSKVISMNGDNYITSQVTNFTFTITLDDGTANYVWVDGISMMGEGISAYGQITVDDNGNNVLYLWNQAYAGSDGDGNYAVWYAFADTMDDYYFINGEFPVYILTMNNNGSISFELCEGTLSNDEPFKVVAFDVVAVDSSYNIQGLYNDVWKYGEWTNITKTEATPRTQSRKAFNHILKPCDASVVYAM